MSEIPILSIHQPWAGMIMEGEKRVENRTWKPPPWLIGKWLGIHATGKTISVIEMGAIQEHLRPHDKRIFPLKAPEKSSILGVVRVVDVVTQMDDVFFVGPYGWILESPIIAPRDEPAFLEVRGQQKLWSSPALSARLHALIDSNEENRAQAEP